jgi:hypothetical protein
VVPPLSSSRGPDAFKNPSYEAPARLSEKPLWLHSFFFIRAKWPSMAWVAWVREQVGPAPRSEARNVCVATPASLAARGSWSFGTMVRVGAFIIGSDRIGALFGLNDLHGADLFFGDEDPTEGQSRHKKRTARKTCDGSPTNHTCAGDREYPPPKPKARPFPDALSYFLPTNNSRTGLRLPADAQLVPSSFFTSEAIRLPSAWPASRLFASPITFPMSFMPVAPVSAMMVRTACSTSSSLRRAGR